jgi:hypothetical protein
MSEELVQDTLPQLQDNSEFVSRIRQTLQNKLLDILWEAELNKLNPSNIEVIDKSMLLRGKEGTELADKMFFLDPEKVDQLQEAEVVDPVVDAALLREHGCEITRISMAPTPFVLLPRTSDTECNARTLYDVLQGNMWGLVHALHTAGSKVVATRPDASCDSTADPDIGELHLYGWVGVLKPT